MVTVLAPVPLTRSIVSSIDLFYCQQHSKCLVEVARDMSALRAARVSDDGSMDSYSKAAMEREMKVQELILRAMAKKLIGWHAAEIIAISDGQMRRWRERYEEFRYDGLFDRQRGQPSPQPVPLAMAMESFPPENASRPVSVSCWMRRITSAPLGMWRSLGFTSGWISSTATAYNTGGSGLAPVRLLPLLESPDGRQQSNEA
jgi:hypothetical protein